MNQLLSENNNLIAFPYFTSFKEQPMRKEQRINWAESLLDSCSSKELKQVLEQLLGTKNQLYWRELLTSNLIARANCFAQFENPDLVAWYQQEQNASLLQLVSGIKDEHHHLLIKVACERDRFTIPHLYQLVRKDSCQSAQQEWFILYGQILEQLEQAKAHLDESFQQALHGQVPPTDRDLLFLKALAMSRELSLDPIQVWKAYPSYGEGFATKTYYDGIDLGNPNHRYLSEVNHQKLLTRVKRTKAE